ncbi:MAG: methionyl-tRNA formyltransferase [Bacteroidetes bacterium HGW-Bacteroidetes-17]|nr:MAG: methionyl-tRNA formyltransferase [Bacteroidetes bacterium HGW-Bacteroidetes-17]
MNKTRIIFMGTPEFAVPSLDILIKNGFDVSAVITAPDKPSGRGRMLSESAIKAYALANSIPILQPTNLKDPEFINDLKKLNADLQVVVAFRMLPERVWAMPKLGTFNLHASLLPNYRGAAPINWAIINGETETGVSTFFLNKDIDTGSIIFQEKVKIQKNETAGELHDTLMMDGASLVLKTVNAIISGEFTLTEQTLKKEEIKLLKTAPKIFKEYTRINWEKPAKNILNLINGLSPYPTAYTMIKSEEMDAVQLKIFKAEMINTDHQIEIGKIRCDGKSKMEIACAEGMILLREVQLSGKKRMKIEEFLRGFSIKEGWIAQ